MERWWEGFSGGKEYEKKKGWKVGRRLEGGSKVDCSGDFCCFSLFELLVYVLSRFLSRFSVISARFQLLSLEFFWRTNWFYLLWIILSLNLNDKYVDIVAYRERRFF